MNNEHINMINKEEQVKSTSMFANQVQSKSPVRESGVELLRIITMFFIVAHHYVVNSGLTMVGGPIFDNPFCWRSIFLLLFGAWGKTGINCFVLITGYFMCKSKITLKKFFKLLFEILFYRWIIYAIFLIVGYEQFSIKSFVKALFPITSVQQNFTGCYLLFFLSIPFLNILVRNMKEKQHIRLLLLTGFIYVFFGTLKVFSVSMNYVSWFIVLYFLSSYIRLYPKTLFQKKKLWGWLAILSVIISSISVIACAWLGAKINRPNMAYFFVSDSNTFLALSTGLCAFMFFKNLNLKPKKFINCIAASTFGVLLIHANSDAMRDWLWVDLLNNVGMYYSQWIILHAVGSVCAIFIICTIIDYLRIRFLEKPFFNWFDKKIDKLSNWYQQKERKIFDKLHIKED